MRRIGSTLAGIALLALAIAAFAPASLVDAEVAARTSGALRIAQAQGTLWAGRGVLAAGDGSWRLPIAWRIAPLPLAHGVVDVTLAPVDPASDAPRGRLQWQAGGMRAEGLAVRLPARALAKLAGAPLALVGGDVELRADSLSLAHDGGAGGASALWGDARLRVPGYAVMELGRVEVKLGVRGKELHGEVASRGGEVAVSGEVAFGRERQSVNLGFAADRSAPPAARAALAALGTPDASGVVKLRSEHGAR